MSQQTFTFIERRAIWEAHNKKCGHCREAISFADMEIDHILPESLKNADVGKWNQLLKSHGLSIDFELNGYENLLPSCFKCNSRKGSNVLAPGIVAIHHHIAKHETPRIINLITKFKREDQLDKLRFNLAAAFESGDLTSEQLQRILGTVREKSGTFKLSSPVIGETPLMELSKQKYEDYLDMDLKLPDWLQPGLRLVGEHNEERYVSKLREYKDSVAAGFFADSNAEIKTAAAYFVRPLQILNLLLYARLAERSFIDEPKRGLADIALLPATLFFSIEENTDEIVEGRKKALPTIGDLVDAKQARITKIGSDFIYIEDDEHWTFIFEIMRADVDADGTQELIANFSGGPLRGTLVVSDVIVLGRKSESANFHTVKI